MSLNKIYCDKLKFVKVKTYLISFYEIIEEKQNSKNNTREVDVFEGRQAGPSYIKGDPLNGYYDFVITEGSYKFWVVFQVIYIFCFSIQQFQSEHNLFWSKLCTKLICSKTLIDCLVKEG